MVELKDIDGIISLPAVEGRFKEILSVQKIKDTMTGIEYDGVVDTDFLILINELNDENEQLKMGINSLKLLVKNWEALDEEKDGQIDKQNQALKKLKKENEQLKSEVKSLRIKHNDFSDPVDKKLLETVRRLFE